MTERFYRLSMGIILMVLLYLDNAYLCYVYAAIMLLEGITNQRISLLVSRVRYGADWKDHVDPPAPGWKINFDAERAFRIAFALTLVVLLQLPGTYWPLAWMLSVFVTMAGLVNLCPTVIMFRALGFR